LTLEFFVAGRAQTAGSKSIVPKMKDGVVVSRRVVESGDRNAKAAWRADLRLAAEDAREAARTNGDDDWPTDRALSLTLVFYRVRPKAHFGTGRNAGVLKTSAPQSPTTRPDLLKVARATEDALTGIVWADDSVIVAEHLYKRWGEREGVQVVVRTLDVDTTALVD
jgi:Holliday junction resolvase RusA-like endonuclease